VGLGCPGKLPLYSKQAAAAAAARCWRRGYPCATARWPAASCLPTNNAPTRTSKSLLDVTEPQVFILAELFQDVDGDSLTYEIIVSNSSVVNTTVVDGTYLHVTRGFEKSEQSVTESGTVTIIVRDSSAQTNDTFTVTFAFVPQIPVETLAFHHGDFNASDYGGTHSDVGSAALAGLVYADTPMGDYAWGTLKSQPKTPVVSVSFTTAFQGWKTYSYAYSSGESTPTVYVYDIVYGFTIGGMYDSIQYNTLTSRWSDLDTGSPVTVTHVGRVVTGYQNGAVLFTFDDPYDQTTTYQWEPKIPLKADVLMVAGGGGGGGCHAGGGGAGGLVYSTGVADEA
jgi:hypothetical protein